MRSGLRTVLFGLAAMAGLAAPAAAQEAAAPPPATAPAALTAESFARLPFVEQAKLSPDGNSVAGLYGIAGQQVIGIASLFDKTSTPFNIGIPDGTEASWIRWVNNDNVLVGLYALLPIGSGGERWVVSRMIGINLKTRKISRLMWDKAGQDAADLIWVANDGSPTVLAAAQSSIYLGEDFWPAVYRVDVEKNRSFQVQKGKGGVYTWNADGAGTVRSGVGYDDSSRKFRLYYRGEAGSGESLRIVDIADTRKEEGILDPFLFLPGTNHALALHDNEQGRTAIYEVDMLSQEDVRTYYEAPGEGEVEGVVVSADGQTLLGAWISRNEQEIHWFDEVLANVQDSVSKSVAQRRARIMSMSQDRTKLLIVIDRPDTPGALYYFDITGGAMQRIAIMNDALGAKPLSPVKMIQYKARDGTEIEAVLTLPRGREAKNLPIVMLPHGGPWAQDTDDYDYWAQFIASRGYAVLQPNFRGSTGYGTAFMKKGEGQMGLAMQDDVSDGLAWAVAQGIADPKRVCIVGASYGGYAAMWGIAKDPDLYRCAISIAGVSNLRREVNDFGDSLMGNKYKDDWAKMTPDFAAVSPANAVARIKAPLLLIHGKKDITVDFNQSSNMFGKMRAAGKTVELVPLPEADHHFTREADRKVLLTSIGDFLAKYNPADPPPTPAAK